MSSSMTRRGFVGGMAGIGVTSGLVGSPAAATPPDTTYVKKLGRGWRVLPTGLDDHDNIEWALRNTAPGGTVKLEAGIYKFGSTVVVPDFDGKLIGAGPDETTLTCSDKYNYELWEAPGGGKDMGQPVPPRYPRVPIANTPTLAAPGIIFFYKTPPIPGNDPLERANRIELRGMRCRGAMRGADWTFGDEVLCFTVANTVDFENPEAIPVTTRQDVLVADIVVDGYKTTEFPIFENSCACISVAGGLILTDNYDLQGVVDGDMFGAENGGMLGLVPAEGDVTFSNCLFRNCRVGPGVVGYKNGNILYDGLTTDGCRGNCVQLIDNSGCNIEIRNSDLFCDSFLLPPELTVGGAVDVPSSLGCVFAAQGATAAAGVFFNLRWLTLAIDEEAHEHPLAGPLGTWRPLGPQFLPEAPSKLTIVDTSCRSSGTINTYCFHVVDFANGVFGVPSVDATIKNNSCRDSQTCVSLEYVSSGTVKGNECASQSTGVELYGSPTVTIEKNTFDFPQGTSGCEIRILTPPYDKLDLSRVAPNAGSCSAQA